MIIPVNGQKCMIRWREETREPYEVIMLRGYYEVEKKYGQAFAENADRIGTQMMCYTHHLFCDKNSSGKPPKSL